MSEGETTAAETSVKAVYPTDEAEGPDEPGLVLTVGDGTPTRLTVHTGHLDEGLSETGGSGFAPESIGGPGNVTVSDMPGAAAVLVRREDEQQSAVLVAHDVEAAREAPMPDEKGKPVAETHVYGGAVDGIDDTEMAAAEATIDAAFGDHYGDVNVLMPGEERDVNFDALDWEREAEGVTR